MTRLVLMFGVLTLTACGSKADHGDECEVDDDCKSSVCSSGVCQGGCDTEEDCCAECICSDLGVSGGSPGCYRECSGDSDCVGEYTCSSTGICGPF